MEWLWQLMDRFQKSAAVTALQNASPIDWILLMAIFWGLVQGSRKGFSDMFGKLLGIFLVSMLTISFYQEGAAYINASLPVLPLKVAEPFVFFLLTIFLWVAVSWGLNIFGKLFQIRANGLLESLGGMIFGVLRMVLLLSFVAQFFLLLPVESVQQTFKQGRTYAGYTISRFVPDLHKLVVSPFRKPTFKKPVEVYKVGG
ncbi:MAG: CvpA family protein [Candidatus Omnitrophica bacterium]|nr:CvpA family protein [Candidatus Omnitrophota bacterium]